MVKLSSFTREEKEKCLPVVDLMLECANVASEQGVLALDEWVKGRNPYLVYLISRITDGFDPQFVQDVAQRLIETDGHEGENLLSQMIMMEGLMMVQTGLKTCIMEHKLLAMLGLDFLVARGYA